MFTLQTSRKISQFMPLSSQKQKKKKALSNLAFPWQIMRNEVHSATEMVNTSLNLLRQVKHIRWDDKIFIKVSPNHVGVKNYSSCIVQSADVDWAKINKQEFSLSQPSHEYLTDTDSLLVFFWKITLRRYLHIFPPCFSLFPLCLWSAEWPCASSARTISTSPLLLTLPPPKAPPLCCSSPPAVFHSASLMSHLLPPA